MTQSSRERMRAQESARAAQQRMRRIVGVGAAILAAVLVTVLVVVAVQASNSGGNSVTPPNATAGRNAIIVNPGVAKPGTVVVDLFFDYQCPICKQFESVFGSALDALASAGDIQLQYRAMTFMDNNLGNDSSMKTAIAASCADFEGKYSAYHNALFANQPTKEGEPYSTELVRNLLPQEVGITGAALTRFQTCFDQKATKGFVQGVDEQATKDGVTGTPTLHVNGRKIELDVLAKTNPADLGKLIDQYR